MGEMFGLLIPVIIMAVAVFAAAPLINMFKGAFGESSGQTHQKDAKYSRQVHQMHVKDAEGERRHRLDQLKSLYEAGMMERDEYNERVAAVETEYQSRH
ncbi:MAG: hypothetical protein IKL57_06530 [Oscillospiraceae bacterium]|nr:hypothetical protein [Oscillospiraceae bacterium]MBR3611090.1 hypothetical protein [Oscillospiraceae bacterium]